MTHGKPVMTGDVGMFGVVIGSTHDVGARSLPGARRSRKRGFKVAIDRSDNARGSFYRIQTDRSDDANAAAAADDEGRANSAAVRKKSSRSAKPQARRAA